jgi:hypothetical protein
VDWIPLLYYCAGLMTLGAILFSVLKSNRKERQASNEFLTPDNPVPVSRPKPVSGRRSNLIASLSCALFGLMLPVVEAMIPARYPGLSQDELVDRFIAGLSSDELEGSSLSRSTLADFLVTQPGSVILYGRALYPGFYHLGEYWGDDNTFLLAARQYDRLQFRLLGPEVESVFIPLKAPPEFFPHASDVLIVGCKSQAGILALSIRLDDHPRILMTDPWNGLACPYSR